MRLEMIIWESMIFLVSIWQLMEHLKLFAVNMLTESREHGPAVVCVGLIPDRIGATSTLPSETNQPSWRTWVM